MPWNNLRGQKKKQILAEKKTNTSLKESQYTKFAK